VDAARRRLLELLVQHSFARRRVVLASGRTSDFFIDCKQTVLLGEGHALVGEVMLGEVSALGGCRAVAGVELGGCPLASAVALTSFLRARDGGVLDAVYVRKAAKDHGSARLVEGDSHLLRGTRIALLEDVVTTGGSTLKAAAALRDAGYDVAGVVALVDRQEGGAEAILEAGVPFRAVYTRSAFP
jgi:orotate phosphoribosyltransferase